MNIKYSEEHEWITVDGDIATCGISNFAQEQLGDVVFVEMPEVGRNIDKGEEVGVVESVKAASEIFTPVGGEVVPDHRTQAIRRARDRVLQNHMAEYREALRAEDAGFSEYSS